MVCLRGQLSLITLVQALYQRSQVSGGGGGKLLCRADVRCQDCSSKEKEELIERALFYSRSGLILGAAYSYFPQPSNGRAGESRDLLRE